MSDQQRKIDLLFEQLQAARQELADLRIKLRVAGAVCTDATSRAEKAEGKAEAWDDIERRADDAHAIAQRAAQRNAKHYGRNVWHVALDEVEAAEATVGMLHGQMALIASLSDPMIQGTMNLGLIRDTAKAALAATDGQRWLAQKLAEERERVRELWAQYGGDERFLHALDEGVPQVQEPTSGARTTAPAGSGESAQQAPE